MKNKVLRLAIVAVLVVAMILSMAACEPTVPPVTPTPTPGPVVTPTPTPATTQTPTPVVPGRDDDAALAKATYGFELIKTDFTFGTTAGEKTTTKLEYNAKLLENYKKTSSLPFEVKFAVSYEGEGKVTKDMLTAGHADAIFTVTGVKVEFKATAPAGTYTITATVTAEDLGFDFGRFGSIKEEKVTYELITVVNVAKADLTIKTPSYVAPVKITTDAPVAPAFVADTSLTTAMEKAFGNGNVYFLKANAALVDITKAGSYELVPYAFKSGTTDVTAKEDNAISFDELVSINYNVTFENGKQHFISEYDWNVVRDTATSIIELDALNADVKLTLARARYDALTAEQKVFFATGAIVVNTAAPSTIWDAKKITIGQFGGTNSTIVELNIAASVTGGKEILKKLTDAETVVANNAIFKAFNKVVTDSKFDQYVSTFNPANSTHMASFNAVKAYLEALSEKDLKVIKENTATGSVATGATDAEKAKSYYTSYTTVAASTTDGTSREEALIAAAIAAYNRVVKQTTTVIFEDALANGENAYEGVVYYVNNAEVKAVTAQAKAAYDKLTKEQKAKIDILALTATDAADASANFDKDVLTYGKALKALVAMNEVVGYMDQVVSHTKIEDLAHTKDASPAYEALQAIVYGKNLTGTAANYVTVTGRTTFNAIHDIMEAFAKDSASLDAVVAEYKAMIDYVLAAEAYKATVVAAFNAAIAEEFTVANGRNESEIGAATAASNPVMLGLAKAITTEGKHTVKTIAATGVSEVTVVICKNTAQAILNKSNETYADAIAQFEDMINLDKASSTFNTFFAHIPGKADATKGSMITFA